MSACSTTRAVDGPRRIRTVKHCSPVWDFNTTPRPTWAQKTRYEGLEPSQYELETYMLPLHQYRMQHASDGTRTHTTRPLKPVTLPFVHRSKWDLRDLNPDQRCVIPTCYRYTKVPTQTEAWLNLPTIRGHGDAQSDEPL